MKPIHLLRKFFFILQALLAMNLVTADTIPSNPSHAVFGGGCFWCMEAIFRNQPGVISVISGFAGGTTKKPSYKEVCTGQTGHAEVIQITYDPKKVSYTQLLSLFWRAHDPTTLNRQGADQGPQYRSIILTTSSEQMTEAQASKKKLEAELNKSITTEIKPLITFTPADKEHQDYYFNNQQAPYCRAVIAPKLKKLSLE